MKILKAFKKNQNDIRSFGPLYHSYDLFGLKNDILPGNYEKNQKAKEPVLLGYVSLAIAKSKKNINDKVSFSELFCADGYYSMFAKKLGSDPVYAIDNDKDQYTQRGQRVAEHLGLDVKYIYKDINDLDKENEVDIIANVGGLYHVSNPEELLVKSYNLAKKYLIVQNVVSLAKNDKDYFETPAPGWTWGSRYSKESFQALIKKLKFKIIDEHFNILEGNEREEDRGSLYYLIEK